MRGKLLVMGIRRLPAWALSDAHHRARHGVDPDYRPQPLPEADEIARTKDPDDMVRWMTDADRLPVRRWLRTEHLLEDMLALLGELGELTPDARRRVTAVAPRNVGILRAARGALVHAEQLAALYEHNPTWARVERGALRRPGRASRLAIPTRRETGMLFRAKRHCGGEAQLPLPPDSASPGCSERTAGFHAKRASPDEDRPPRG